MKGWWSVMVEILLANPRIAVAQECVQLPHHHEVKDPFKAKWAIARACSAIHDKVGKPTAPLDRFLSPVCPQLGIIDTAQYLQELNSVVEAKLSMDDLPNAVFSGPR